MPVMMITLHDIYKILKDNRTRINTMKSSIMTVKHGYSEQITHRDELRNTSSPKRGKRKKNTEQEDTT